MKAQLELCELDDITSETKNCIAKNKGAIWDILNSLIYNEKFFQQVYDIEQDVNKIAEANNCNIILPKKNQLQIDIDCKEQYTYFRGRVNDLKYWMENSIHINIVDIIEKPSKTGLPHQHITITLDKDITDEARVAFQFMFGSDILRESLNALRLAVGITPNILFFEPK